MVGSWFWKLFWNQTCDQDQVFGFNPKFEDNDLKSGCYRVPKLPPLSVNYVCPISHKTNHPIMIPKIVLKSVLWRGSESALTFWIFQLLCFSLHPSVYRCDITFPLDSLTPISNLSYIAWSIIWQNSTGTDALCRPLMTNLYVYGNGIFRYFDFHEFCIPVPWCCTWRASNRWTWNTSRIRQCTQCPASPPLPMVRYSTLALRLHSPRQIYLHRQVYRMPEPGQPHLHLHGRWSL